MAKTRNSAALAPSAGDPLAVPRPRRSSSARSKPTTDPNPAESCTDSPAEIATVDLGPSSSEVPADEAITDVARQLELIDTAKPFNFEGAWMDIEEQQARVDVLAAEHERDAEVAKASKKALDAARETLGHMVHTYRDRRVAKARQLAEAAEKAAQQAAETTAQAEREADYPPPSVVTEAQPEAVGAAL